MAEPFNHERLEAMIIHALRVGAQAEPRDGLEERVIATMRSQAVAVAGQRRPWSWMAGALAAAALLLFTLAEIGYPPLARPPLDTSQQRDHKKIAQGASSIMPHGHVQKGPGAPSRIRQPYPAARSAPVATQTRLAHFPAPAPLSADEKSLIAWLRRAPTAIAAVRTATMDSERKSPPDKDPFAVSEDSEPKFTELAFLYPQDHAREDSKKYDRGGPR